MFIDLSHSTVESKIYLMSFHSDRGLKLLRPFIHSLFCYYWRTMYNVGVSLAFLVLHRILSQPNFPFYALKSLLVGCIYHHYNFVIKLLDDFLLYWFFLNISVFISFTIFTSKFFFQLQCTSFNSINKLTTTGQFFFLTSIPATNTFMAMEFLY